MARRPFFSGNYGSALGSTAQAADIIARAGEQRGQRLANMGAQIGGMIQQYGLNKEKQKENKATIKSSIGILERMKKLDPENEPQYMMQIEQLNNEDMGLGMRAKLADKTLQGLSITSRLQSDILNAKEQEQNLNIAKENRDIKKAAATAKEKAYKSIDAQIDQIGQDILDGMSYEDLPPYSKSLLANRNLIKNRQIPLEDLVYNPREELDEKTARLNFEILQGEKKKQDAVIEKTGAETESILQDTKDAKAEASILPEFTDKASALASVKDRDPGVSAKIVPFKGGFNVSMEFKAKDFPTSVQPLEGFDDVYSYGGYLYKGITDKNGKTTMTKIAAEQIGQRSDLLGKAIDRLDDKTLGNYRVAKRDGELNDDGDYEFKFYDKDTGEYREMTIPFNPILEDRLKYVDELTSKYQKTLDKEIDLDLTTR